MNAPMVVGACPLETERLDFVGINETCGSASDPHLCTACPLSIVQKIVDGGYSVEEINALPIERCLLENLPQLLEHGATLLALLALQNCDFNSGNLSMDILNSVVFPPPYPGLPTEWLRNGTASPSSSSSDDAPILRKTFQKRLVLPQRTRKNRRKTSASRWNRLQ